MTVEDLIRQHWGKLLIVLSALVTVFGWGAKAYVDDRVDSVIESKMADIGKVSDDRVTAIEKDVEEQSKEHDSDTEEWKRRIERIVEILLEE